MGNLRKAQAKLILQGFILISFSNLVNGTATGDSVSPQNDAHSDSESGYITILKDLRPSDQDTPFFTTFREALRSAIDKFEKEEQKKIEKYGVERYEDFTIYYSDTFGPKIAPLINGGSNDDFYSVISKPQYVTLSFENPNQSFFRTTKFSTTSSADLLTRIRKDRDYTFQNNSFSFKFKVLKDGKLEISEYNKPEEIKPLKVGFVTLQGTGESQGLTISGSDEIEFASVFKELICKLLGKGAKDEQIAEINKQIEQCKMPDYFKIDEYELDFYTNKGKKEGVDGFFLSWKYLSELDFSEYRSESRTSRYEGKPLPREYELPRYLFLKSTKVVDDTKLENEVSKAFKLLTQKIEGSSPNEDLQKLQEVFRKTIGDYNLKVSENQITLEDTLSKTLSDAKGLFTSRAIVTQLEIFSSIISDCIEKLCANRDINIKEDERKKLKMAAMKSFVEGYNEMIKTK